MPSQDSERIETIISNTHMINCRPLLKRLMETSDTEYLVESLDDGSLRIIADRDVRAEVEAFLENPTDPDVVDSFVSFEDSAVSVVDILEIALSGTPGQRAAALEKLRKAREAGTLTM